MIAVDTNILVYAERVESPFYEKADRCIAELAEGQTPWAIPWPCVHEFISVVTRRGVFTPPTTMEQALRQVEYWMESPSLRLLSESGAYWQELRKMALQGKMTGAMIHDARVAALCRQHGVRVLWSADRDFSRCGGLRVENPLI